MVINTIVCPHNGRSCGRGGGGSFYGPVRHGGLAVYFAIVDCGFLSRAAAWLKKKKKKTRER